MKQKLYNLCILIFSVILPLRAKFYLFKFFQNIQGLGFSLGLDSEIKSVKKFLKNKNDVIIFDIGANKGKYTEKLLKSFKKAKFYLFEPQKNCAEILANKFKFYKNVKINNIAISNRESKIYLYYDKLGSSKASLYQRKIEHHNLNLKKKQRVQAINLNNYLKKHSFKKISLCKIDIEGHEYEVLNSIKNNFHLFEVIQFEFGGCNIDSKIFFRDIYYLLNDNFDIFRITPSGPNRIKNYDEIYEIFMTSNYLAVNKKRNY